MNLKDEQAFMIGLGVLIYLKKNLNKQLGGENNGNV